MLQEFVDDLQREAELWERVISQGNGTPPEPEQPERRRRETKWKTVNHPQRNLVPLPECRQIIADAIRHEGSAGDRELIVVKAPPGSGKTWALVDYLQDVAQRGHRSLYLMSRHKHWDTIQDMPHFSRRLWYHWLSFAHPVPGKEDERMCRYHNGTSAWMQRGYPLHHACASLCPLYMKQCPYRSQKHITAPIVAGVHEHVVTGLAQSDFSVAAVDEGPVRAFLQPRFIPASGVISGYGAGPVAELQKILLGAISEGAVLRGRELMDRIGDILPDAFAQLLDIEELELLVPHLRTEDDLSAAPYWYVGDLARLLIPEHMAWQEGWKSWVSRVIVTRSGIHLLTKSKVWAQAPDRIVSIDATAPMDIYQALFPGHNIHLVEPEVELKGKTFQIVDSSYNKTSMLDKSGPRHKAHDVAALCKAIIDEKGFERPGVVTFMDLVPFFEEVIPDIRTLHFYGQRGSNDMEGCDVVFIVGTPSPPDAQIEADAATIYQDRITPWGEHDIPVREMSYEPVMYTDEGGLTPTLPTSGFWYDPQLQSVLDMYRSDELLQAVHRGRPLIREDVTIYIFSGSPIDGLTLTGVIEDPSPLTGAPQGIHWKHWPKLSEWVEEQDEITSSSLARAAGVSTRWVRENDWLGAIYRRWPSKFTIEALSSKSGRGRRRKGLVRKEK